MNFSKLVDKIWKDEEIREYGFHKYEIEIIVKKTINYIFESLFEYSKIKIRGFFTLEIKELKGRKIMNPSTKEHMKTKNSYRIKLTPSKYIKEKLKNHK